MSDRKTPWENTPVPPSIPENTSDRVTVTDGKVVVGFLALFAAAILFVLLLRFVLF